MKLFVLAALAGFALAPAAFAATPACTPIPGAEQLWADPQKHVVIIGEMHGTEEIPRLFADLVCAAGASGHPLVIGLELPLATQPALDAFVAGAGDAEARAKFLEEGHWTSPTPDGRSSRAVLELIERLRRMKAEGEVANVFTFVPPRTEGTSLQSYEQAMADAWTCAAASDPDALVLVLVGNLHAMKSAGGRDRGYNLAAALLPAAQTVSLRVVSPGGDAWNCQDGCGPHPWSAEDAGARRVELKPMMGGAFDGVLAVGSTTSASPPASPARGAE